MNIEAKVLGVLLSHDRQQIQTIVNKMSVEWFEISLHKKIFSSIDHLIRQRKPHDSLGVTQHLREKKMLEKGMIGKISQITSDSSMHSLSFTNLINELRAQHNKRQVQIHLQRTQQQIHEDTFTIDDYITRSTEINEILTDKEVEDKDNHWTIEDVIMSHDKAKEGKLPGMELGFSNMSEKVLLEDVDVMIVGARPSVGKTSFGVTVACKKIMDDNKKVAFFALEMSRTQMMRRVVSYFTEIDSNKIKYGKCDKKDINMIKSLHEREEIDNLKIFDGAHTIRDIIRKVTEMKHTEGCDLVIIDYVQKIQNDKSKRYEAVTENSNSVKYMSQNLQIPVIALAQLKRDTDKTKKRPVLSDLKDSGEIEQDASIVAFLHRPEYFGEKTTEDGEDSKNYGEVIIAKNREGILGIHKMNCDMATNKWSTYNPHKTADPDELL